MSNIERLTITVPAELAGVVKDAVAEGEYASVSEVLREALRDWKTKRAVQRQELAALKRDVREGLADAKMGRVKTFDSRRIVSRGRKILATKSG